MRSSRSDLAAALAPPVGLALPFVALATCAALAPPAPQGPRWLGAGRDAPRHGGTLRVFHESDLRSLDPPAAFDEISRVAIDLLFDTLLTHDADGTLVPLLLARLPEARDDGRTYRLELRRDVRFHDGSSFEAEDVRFTLERLVDPTLGFPGASFFFGIEGVDAFRARTSPRVEGVRVLDRHTVEVRLTEVDRTFPHLLALPLAAPVPRRAYAPGVDRTHRPVGSGPFELESFEPSVRLVVRRNPRYWQAPLPYLDRVVYELGLHRGPAFLRFRNGDLDVVHRASAADVRLLAAPAWAPFRATYGMGDLWGLEMNTELPPFDDARVRRAVAFAIDRETWARARNQRLAPLGQPIPPGMPGHDPQLETRQRFDLARARAELRAAGHPDGLPEPVDLWVGEGPVARVYGELAQADLARVGIEVRIKQVSFSVYLRETRRRRTVAFFLGGWNPDFPHPSTFLDSLFHSRAIAEEGAINKAFYASPRVDALLDQARKEPDAAARAALYREASRLIAHDAPWAFVFTQVATEAWQPYVRAYRPSPIRPFAYRDVWLDLPRRSADATRPAGGVPRR